MTDTKMPRPILLGKELLLVFNARDMERGYGSKKDKKKLMLDQEPCQSIMDDPLVAAQNHQS